MNSVVLLCAIGAAQALRSLLVVSEYTNSDLSTQLSSLLESDSTVDVDIVTFSFELFETGLEYPYPVVFDYSVSTVYSARVRLYCSEIQAVCFNPARTAVRENPWTFYLHSDAQAEATALKALLSSLGWPDYYLVSSHLTESLEAGFAFCDQTKCFDDLTGSQHIFNAYVKKTVKPSGMWRLVSIHDGPQAERLVASLEEARIYKEGGGVIFGVRAVYGRYKLGTLLIAEEGFEAATTEAEFEYLAILNSLHLTEQYATLNLRERHLLRDNLRSTFPDLRLVSTFSVLNYGQDNDFTIVGNIYDGVCDLFGPVVYPGNTTDLVTATPTVHISSVHDIALDGYDFVVALLDSGLDPMIDWINADAELLANFELVLLPWRCSMIEFVYEAMAECLVANPDSLGVLHLESVRDGVTMGTIGLMEDFGVQIPHIAYLSDTADMYDKKQFPTLSITTPNFAYMLSIIPYILRAFGWEHVAVYYDALLTHEGAELLFDTIDKFGIEIRNDPQYFYMNELSPEDYELFLPYIKDLDRSNCRVIVSMMTMRSALLFTEFLYDYGFRRGDLAFLLLNRVSESIENDDYYGHDVEKCKQLLDGCVYIFQMEYTGDYGNEIQSYIEPLIAPSDISYTSFAIDALLLAAHAIDFALQLGYDYEDPHVMNEVIRVQRITGCSGTLSIDSAGNGRNELIFQIYNYYAAENNTYVEVKIGKYEIGVIVPLQLSHDIVWPNGSTEVPPDLWVEPQCSVEDASFPALINVLIPCLSAGLAFGIVLILAKVHPAEPPKPLEERKQMWFEDAVTMLIPLTDAVVCLFVTPQAENFQTLNQTVFPGLDLVDRVQLTFADFWYWLYLVLAASSMWSVCFTLYILRLKRCCFKDLRSVIKLIGVRLNLFVPTLLFMVVLVTLLSLFDCRLNQYDQLVLAVDCNSRCWDTAHEMQVGFATVVFTLYIVSAIMAQRAQARFTGYANVKLMPSYILMENLFRLALVLLHLSLKGMPQVLTTVVCGLLVAKTVYVIKTVPSNYARFNWWLRLGNGWLSLSFALMIVQFLCDGESWTFIGIQGGIFAVCAGLGVFVQCKKYPSLLFRKKGSNISKLFRFALGGGVSADSLTVHELDYVTRYGVSEVEQPKE